MSRLRVLIHLHLIALIAPGCAINSLLDQIEDEQAKTAEIMCGCTELFPDTAACESNIGNTDVTAHDRECTEDALSIDRRSSEAMLRCLLDVVERYNGCLKDNFECGTFPLECQQVMEEIEACPELPAEVDAELAECAPPPSP